MKISFCVRKNRGVLRRKKNSFIFGRKWVGRGWVTPDPLGDSRGPP